MSLFTEFRDKQTAKLKKQALSQLRNIRIETAYGPTIDINDPLVTGGPPNPYLQKLRPKITVDVKGMKPMVLAPYGEPGASKWRTVQLGSLALGVGIAYLIYRGIR